MSTCLLESVGHPLDDERDEILKYSEEACYDIDEKVFAHLSSPRQKKTQQGQKRGRFLQKMVKNKPLKEKPSKIRHSSLSIDSGEHKEMNKEMDEEMDFKHGLRKTVKPVHAPIHRPMFRNKRW